MQGPVAGGLPPIRLNPRDARSSRTFATVTLWPSSCNYSLIQIECVPASIVMRARGVLCTRCNGARKRSPGRDYGFVAVFDCFHDMAIGEAAYQQASRPKDAAREKQQYEALLPNRGRMRRKMVQFFSTGNAVKCWGFWGNVVAERGVLWSIRGGKCGKSG